MYALNPPETTLISYHCSQMSTMRFTFTGTSISCYGIVANVWDSTQIGFSIDGGTETMYNRNVTDVSHQENSAEDFDYGVQLFTATNLSPTSHTLVLTGYLKSALFGFDYLEYTPVDVSTTTGVQSSSSPTTSNIQTTGVTTSTSTNSTSMSTSTSTSTPTSSLPPISISTASVGSTDLPTILPSDPRLTSQQGGESNKATLAGGAIGAVAVLALLAFGVYWYIRRKRRNGPSRVEAMATESAQPFSLPDQPYAIPLSEKQRLVASTRLTPSSEQTNRIAYQAYAKPNPQGWIRSPAYETPSENENSTASYSTEVSSPQEQQDPLTHSTAPPSFRTRPLTAQYQHGHANDARLIGSNKTLAVVPNDGLQSFGLSPEEGDDMHTSGTEQLNSAPPYLEDVLARTDARNLSENDVDTIARRLAEVMRINNATRGGPGLLRGAPPRELIDQLVEEHLDAREDIS